MRRLDVEPSQNVFGDSSNRIVKWLANSYNKLWDKIRRNFSLTAWYKHLSLCGESYFRPPIWAFLIILLFTGIDWILGNFGLTEYKSLVITIGRSCYRNLELVQI